MTERVGLWLLPAGEDGFYGYSALGERMGFMVSSCWGKVKKNKENDKSKK